MKRPGYHSSAPAERAAALFSMVAAGLLLLVAARSVGGAQAGFLPPAVAETLSSSAVITGALTVQADVPALDSGGGEYTLPAASELTDRERQDVQATIDRNIQRLGLQAPHGLAPARVGLSLPVRAAAGLTDYGFNGISAFVDHNAAYPNKLLDYACGYRTYDLTGYNHKGTDFFTWPFAWSKMDHDEVEIVAAAPGTIVVRQDGNYDRNCAMNSNPWNGVIIQHADGSRAWYLHMKRYSVTAKGVGDTVAQGEYLGIVGSSGSSTGPHLHFELHDAANVLVDPWEGACNATASWWNAQRPYYDSTILKVTTGGAAPVFPACPNAETSNARDRFDPGEIVYFTTYYRDQRSGQESYYAVIQPGGAIFRNWSAALGASYYAASYWYWSYALPANAAVGPWRFEVVYLGQTYARTFTVPGAVSLRGSPDSQAIYLEWDTAASLPGGATWSIAYDGPAGTQPSPVAGLPGATRAYALSGLANHTWYTVTLTAMAGLTPVMTATVNVMPTDHLVYLPLVADQP